MHPTMLLLTVQREREAELERLAIRRPLWRERSPRRLGEKRTAGGGPRCILQPVELPTGADRPAQKKQPVLLRKQGKECRISWAYVTRGLVVCPRSERLGGRVQRGRKGLMWVKIYDVALAR